MNQLTTSPLVLALVLAALLRWPGRTMAALSALAVAVALAAATVALAPQNLV